MRATLTVLVIALGALPATGPASGKDQRPVPGAGLDRERVLALCVSQPVLEHDRLVAAHRDTMNQVHDPALDGTPEEQFVNAVRWMEGNRCADKIVAHPDVFSAIASQQSVADGGSSWENAWVAFNGVCRLHPSGKCIRDEVSASEALRNANAHGPTPASRVCSLVIKGLPSSATWKRCMDTVADQRKSSDLRDPDEGVIRTCIASLELHSETDGAVAGRKVAQCFRTAEARKPG